MQLLLFSPIKNESRSGNRRRLIGATAIRCGRQLRRAQSCELSPLAGLVWKRRRYLFHVCGKSMVAGASGRKGFEPFAGVDRILVHPEFDQVLDGGGAEGAFFKGSQ